MIASSQAENAPVQYVNRDHSRLQYLFILSSVSMCITVDILQYSMPLAFLPSVLEDRGHSPMKIATAIGVYYWTGLLGGSFITSYEVWKMLYLDHKHDPAGDRTPLPTVKKQIKLVIFNLGVGVITLFVQACSPRWHVHTTCRFIQGFVGAFLFFYVFLLNVAVFKGQQQVVAMTFASCATVLAELAGPLVGSFLYDYGGQKSVFFLLGLISVFNQIMLVIVHNTVSGDEAVPSPRAPELEHDTHAVSDDGRKWWQPLPGSGKKMKALVTNKTFIVANLTICMAGVIKGSVEEMLPFHADHEWGYTPIEIGQLFCFSAIAYMIGAAIITQTWLSLGRMQVGFSAQAIAMLGISAAASFHVAYYYKSTTVLTSVFCGYGFCAGLVFTAASQLIADVIDRAEGHDKDAANGMWNTTWEIGGSTGFFLGGYLAHYHTDQMMLTTRYAICACIVAVTMCIVRYGTPDPIAKGDKQEHSALYGSTA